MVGADLALGVAEIDKLVFWRSPDSISTVLDGETVILNIVSGGYSGLNEVGTAVWNLLENHVTLADMREILLAEFDVTHERVFQTSSIFFKGARTQKTDRG